MARPERNNVDYFPFICEEGNKMFYIEETYGNDGFATFVKLLRELAKANHHFLDLSKPTTVMFLSAKCKVSKETLLSIIKDLVELGKFDTMLWNENSIVWCQDFVDSIQDAYFKRKNKCITYQGLLLLLVSLGVRKQGKLPLIAPINPQSKVKYNKLEEIIEKETKTDNLKKSENDVYSSELLENQSWIETISMQNNLKPNEINQWIEIFNKKLISELDNKFNLKDYAAHFSRWLPTEIAKIKKNAEKTGNSNIYKDADIWPQR